MDKLKRLKYDMDSLCIYDVKSDPVMARLNALLDGADTDKIFSLYSDFFRTLSVHDSLRHYIARLILTADNAFTKAAAAGEEDKLPAPVMRAVQSDLQKLEALSALTGADFLDSAEADKKELLSAMPLWETGRAAPPLTAHWETQIPDLIAFHRQNGYGEYAKYAAFTWRGGDFVPITTLDNISLTDLKNYEAQRAQVVDNTLSFLAGLPANNILLYGDRGTGKSSTVHAILNEYKSQGLRMIEISKGDINDLTLIRESISSSPMKFIIFIDDLSFDSHDDSFGELKAALEGSLSGRQSNTLIYATSNRRHLIKENFSDRENDVHRSDTLQEELSLSDRFGLSVNFMNPDKKDYLDIVRKIAADRGLQADGERLDGAAELWARRRGGRSPRCAKQFVDYVESCEKRGMDW